MTILEKIRKLLENAPEARERRNKDKFIVEIIKRDIGEIYYVPAEALVEAVRLYTTHDRAWRKITRENPDLRGSDYNEKHILEDNKLKELGYKENE